MFSLAARQAAGRSRLPVLAVLVVLLVAPAGAGAATSATLIGHWTFDEGSGTTAADSSGGGHPLTLVGGASVGARRGRAERPVGRRQPAVRGGAPAP